MQNSQLKLNVKDSTVISGCYANQGGAIYLKNMVTLNISGSPEFTKNGYTVSGQNATAGACIYLEQGSKVNISGAPKFRACQIIEELEQSRRGIYGGAVGYLDLAGNLDICIAIRLVYKKNNEITVRSGAGIVADSVPENEFRECLNKARAVTLAIETAEGGLDK